MKHLTEKVLTARALAYDSGRLERHLEACPQCRARLQELEAVLDLTLRTPTPEPEGAFADRLWSRMKPRLQEPPRAVTADRWRRRIWLLAPAVAILLLVVWAMRLPRATPPAAPQPTAHATPSPVLLLAVSQHLDRTQALLVELGHASSPAPGQQQTARELLASNRLYQQGASADGDSPISTLLAAIEPALIELAHTPDQVSPAAWRQMQQRIAASGLLFKVRVVDQSLQSHLAARVPQEQDGTL